MNKVYFENIEIELIKLICSAKSEIKIAVCWFTNSEIFSHLLKHLDLGIEIELIINDDIINNNKNSLNFETFIEKGGKLFFCKNEYFMHHKFMVIDNSHIETGSYNFTEIAEKINIENIVILNDEKVTMEFINQFNYLKSLSKPILNFNRNNILNSFSSNFVKPNLNIQNSENNKIRNIKFIVKEVEIDTIELINTENNEIVKIFLDDVEKIYFENDIIKIEYPFTFVSGIKLNGKIFTGSYKTNIIENPKIIN